MKLIAEMAHFEQQKKSVERWTSCIAHTHSVNIDYNIKQ